VAVKTAALFRVMASWISISSAPTWSGVICMAPIPSDVSIDSEVSLLPQGDVFNVGAALKVSLPGVEHDEALKLVHDAHQICPYSNATRGNVDVKLSVA